MLKDSERKNELGVHCIRQPLFLLASLPPPLPPHLLHFHSFSTARGSDLQRVTKNCLVFQHFCTYLLS